MGDFLGQLEYWSPESHTGDDTKNHTKIVEIEESNAAENNQ